MKTSPSSRRANRPLLSSNDTMFFEAQRKTCFRPIPAPWAVERSLTWPWPCSGLHFPLAALRAFVSSSYIKRKARVAQRGSPQRRLTARPTAVTATLLTPTDTVPKRCLKQHRALPPEPANPTARQHQLTPTCRRGA